MNVRFAPGRKRVLCAGRGERCFACSGWGSLESARRHAKRGGGADRCPVCRGLGRTRVVELGDER